MRIGIIYGGIYFGKESPNAAQRRIRDFARGLAAQGHEVFVIVPRNHNPNPDCPDDEYRVQVVGKLSSLFIGKKIENLFSFWKEAWSFVEADIDTLLLYNSRIDASSLMLKAKRSGKIVAVEFCDLKTYWNVNILKNIPSWFDEHVVPKLTTHNIVISETIKRAVLKVASGTPVLKIPITVDSELFSPAFVDTVQLNQKYSVPDNAIKIGYTGTFFKKYGVRYLLEAFAALLKTNSNLKLILAGRDQFTENHDNIPELIKKLNIEKQVTLTGWLNTQEVVEVLSFCDLIVLPHTNDPLCVAGFPTKLGEYAGVGKAIVSTDVGDVNNYFTHEHDIIFCKPNDPKDLELAINKLIQNPELREKLGKNARVVAKKHFNYLNIGKLIADFLIKSHKENLVEN